MALEKTHLHRIKSTVPLTLYDEWDGDNIKGKTGFIPKGSTRSWASSQRVGTWYYLDNYKAWVDTSEAPPGAVDVLPPDNPNTLWNRVTEKRLQGKEDEANEKVNKLNTHISTVDVDENARLFFNDAESGDTGVYPLYENEIDGYTESWHEAQLNNYGSGNGELPTRPDNNTYKYNNPTLDDLSLGKPVASPTSAMSGKSVVYDHTDVGKTNRPNIPQGAKDRVPNYNMNDKYRPNIPQGTKGNTPSHNLNTRTIKLNPRPDNEGSVYQPYFDRSYGSSQFIENINTPYLSKPDDYAGFGQAIQTIKHNMNIFDRGDINKTFTQFNRHRLPLPDQHLPRTIPYVFMTRPNITFMKNGSTLEDQFYKDSLFNSVFEKNPEVIQNLELKHNPDHQFNNILGSMSRSFEVSDEVIKTVEAGETYTGWKMVYGRNTNESNTASQIGIQYTDDSQLRIYYIHKIWLEYINKVYRGEFTPKIEMILDKIIDYSVALYYIVCAADGETILYWSKYYGVFPINTPGSKHSWTYGSPQVNQEFTVNYAYSLKVEMEPSILAEFNTHSSLPFKYRKIYDKTIGTSTPTFVNAPFAEKSFTPEGKAVYKLRFRN